MPTATNLVPWGAFALAVVVLIAWGRRRRGATPRSPAPPPIAAPTFDEAMARFVRPSSDGASATPEADERPDPVGFWVAGDAGSHLVVADAEGPISLYVRGGPSLHGLGAIPAVRAAAVAFREAVAAQRPHLPPLEDATPPDPGGVLVLARSRRGGVGVRVPRDRADATPFADVVRRGHALAAAIVAHAR